MERRHVSCVGTTCTPQAVGQRRLRHAAVRCGAKREREVSRRPGVRGRGAQRIMLCRPPLQQNVPRTCAHDCPARARPPKPAAHLHRRVGSQQGGQAVVHSAPHLGLLQMCAGGASKGGEWTRAGGVLLPPLAARLPQATRATLAHVAQHLQHRAVCISPLTCVRQRRRKLITSCSSVAPPPALLSDPSWLRLAWLGPGASAAAASAPPPCSS